MAKLVLTLVGRLRSSLTHIESAPLQGDEGAPSAWLDVELAFAGCLNGIAVGHEIIILTWLDRARRDVYEVHPRGDVQRPRIGVFATRAPHRPNPIGIHRVRVLEVDPGMRWLKVSGIEAIDGTPVIDVKPILGLEDR